MELSTRRALTTSEVRWLQERGLGGYLSGSAMLRLLPQHARLALADPALREEIHETRNGS